MRTNWAYNNGLSGWASFGPQNRFIMERTIQIAQSQAIVNTLQHGLTTSISITSDTSNPTALFLHSKMIGSTLKSFGRIYHRLDQLHLWTWKWGLIVTQIACWAFENFVCHLMFTHWSRMYLRTEGGFSQTSDSFGSKRQKPDSYLLREDLF